MARVQDKQKAIQLRLEGKSYSEIKNELGISKSTLSVWLSSYPLPSEKIRELRDKNPRRIENFRNTMRKKREVRLSSAYEQARRDFGRMSNREILISGFFLYWGEGGKTAKGTIALSNTDPQMLRFYLRWLSVLGVPKSDITAKIHLYADMNVGETTKYWAKELGLSMECFKKPYVKKSNLIDLSYKNGFGHGTCMIRCYGQKLWEYVIMGMRYLGTEA